MRQAIHFRVGRTDLASPTSWRDRLTAALKLGMWFITEANDAATNARSRRAYQFRFRLGGNPRPDSRNVREFALFPQAGFGISSAA